MKYYNYIKNGNQEYISFKDKKYSDLKEICDLLNKKELEINELNNMISSLQSELYSDINE